jgi:hypothetical protein
MSAGRGVGVPSTGAVVSWTVTVNVAGGEGFEPSVAVHVTVVVPRMKVEPEAGVHVGVTDPTTMSVAEALYVTAAPAELVASAVIGPGVVITGGVVSCTVIVKDIEPETSSVTVSVAVHVTTVEPIGNTAPEV